MLVRVTLCDCGNTAVDVEDLGRVFFVKDKRGTG